VKHQWKVPNRSLASYFSTNTEAEGWGRGIIGRKLLFEKEIKKNEHPGVTAYINTGASMSHGQPQPAELSQFHSLF
jgi:hypothetical protein